MLIPKYRDTFQLRGDIYVEKYEHSELGNLLSPLVRKGEAEGSNLFLTVGINRLLDLLTGNSAATFTNAEAQIGIGDSATAATAGQTDLQAATNKTYKSMDATFPPAAAAGSVSFKSTFGTTDANYTWAEFVVRRATGTLCLDRGVSAMGTKTVAGTWVPTVTISIT